MKNWIHSRLWIYFSFIILLSAVSLSVLAISILTALEIFNLLAFLDTFPFLRWLLPIVLSSIIGIILSIVVSRYILQPITHLKNNLQKVIESDFSIQLDTHHRVQEVNDLYQAFNLMVKELNSLEKFQNDFTAVVSHEFKTPLATIQGYAQLLQKKELTTELRDRYTHQLMQATKQLTNLSDNILNLAKIDNRSLAFNMKRYRLDEQIRESLLNLQNQWETKQIQLDLSLDPLEFVGDQKMMLLVWNNLIENAIHYNRPDGKISIGIRAEDEEIIVDIEDTGIGIPTNELTHIFQRFYQVDSSRYQSGNGLGLAIVYQIIQIHQGRIEVSSQLNQGTRFTIYLPKN